jgi:hypothetical protein
VVQGDIPDDHVQDYAVALLACLFYSLNVPGVSASISWPESDHRIRSSRMFLIAGGGETRTCWRWRARVPAAMAEGSGARATAISSVL